MLGALATLGYAVKDAASQLDDVMMANKHAVVVDTRLTPWCTWSERWQRPGLEHRYGDRYIWKGDVLGNINHHHSELPIQLANEAVGLPWIVDRLEEGTTLLLLCGCAHYERCHRKVIYEKIKTHLGERLPVYALGQQVMTPNGPGIIDPHIPLDVHIARNKYAVLLHRWSPLRYYFPDQLEPYHPEQLTLLATPDNPYRR